MKRTKRLSIDFSHRELAITIRGSTPSVQKSDSDAAETTTTCETCDCPWIDIAATADEDVLTSVDRIRYALQQVGLHMQISLAGQLQICQKSFEVFKEKF